MCFQTHQVFLSVEVITIEDDSRSAFGMTTLLTIVLDLHADLGKLEVRTKSETVKKDRSSEISLKKLLVLIVKTCGKRRRSSYPNTRKEGLFKFKQ